MTKNENHAHISHRDSADYSLKVLASQELMLSLLNGEDVEESLAAVAKISHAWIDAQAALIFLPSLGEMWNAEILDGGGVQHLLGAPFACSYSYQEHLLGRNTEQFTDINDSPLANLGDLSQFGPAVVAPLNLSGNQPGALLVLRDRNEPVFDMDEVGVVETMALQVALILKVEKSRGLEEQAAIFEERERISQDLHDLAIQELFGIGMDLDRLLHQVSEDGLKPALLEKELKSTLTGLERAIAQIRGIVSTLEDTADDDPLSDRLEAETSRARRSLGFAPSLVFQLDGTTISPQDENSPVELQELCSRVGVALANDSVAAVREALSNIARHAEAHSTAVNVIVNGRGVVGELLVTVVDNGVGIPKPVPNGSGIKNMVRRAERHGGSFAVGKGPQGKGTSLAWRVPLEN